MVEYPVEFNSEIEADKSGEKWSLETGEGLETEMTTPVEFGGDEQYPSPEDLFTASVLSCMVATFRNIAERKQLQYDKISSNAEIRLDRGEDSRPVMKEGEISMEVEGVEDLEKAEQVGDAAEKNCFIHNSIKSDVTVDIEFR